MNIIPYDRHAAVEYARRWAFQRNPAYFDFSRLGGNCTNFASQCLVAGGMPMNFHNPMGWFFRSSNDRAPAFTGVSHLYNFLTRSQVSRGPFAVQVDVNQVLPGDIIQLSFDGVVWRHTLVVVEQNGYDPLIATNTDDAFGRLLSSYTFAKARALHILGGRV